jgi:acyl-CoA synthetase (AMP-forming)/AMP-acid ligase II
MSQPTPNVRANLLPDGPLHAVLDAAAARHPDVATTFPADSRHLTLAELADASRRAAHSLRARGVGVGARVGVLSNNDAEFLIALFALSRIGACACPLPLPVTSRDDYPAKVAQIRAVAGMTDVLVSPGPARKRLLLEAAFGTTAVTAVTTLVEDGAAGAPTVDVEVDAGSDVIVQFTSGSTSFPKGVRLSHHNVVAGLRAIIAGIDLGRRGDRAGLWLPLFHDMGLFGTLSALLSGVPVTIWPTSRFVRDPAAWLAEFAAGGHTLTAMPNFGYDLLRLETGPEQVAALDLSRWRVALNGAEPIVPAAVSAFLEHFGPAGFAPEAMMPVYGLAEATLAVTFPRPGTAPSFHRVRRADLAQRRLAVPASEHVDDVDAVRDVAAVGRPAAGMSVRVSDPGTAEPCGPREIGEIEIRGAAVTRGYLSMELSAGDLMSADGWLRTGDLGYLDQDGELYITGRIKEMIVIRGRKWYPDDIEAAVRDDTSLYRGRCVAVAVRNDGSERMALIAETQSGATDHPAIATRLRERAIRVTGLHELHVVLTLPNTIPRTSSGKLQRARAGQKFVPEMR